MLAMCWLTGATQEVAEAPLVLTATVMQADRNSGEASVPAPLMTVQVDATNTLSADYEGRMSVELYRVEDLGFMQITHYYASVTRPVEIAAGQTGSFTFTHADLNEGDEFIAMVTYTYNGTTISGEQNVVGPAVYTITAAQPASLDVNSDGEVNVGDVNRILDYILEHNQ